MKIIKFSILQEIFSFGVIVEFQPTASPSIRQSMERSFTILNTNKIFICLAFSTAVFRIWSCEQKMKNSKPGTRQLKKPHNTQSLKFESLEEKVEMIFWKIGF